jgi:hypothetical protein
MSQIDNLSPATDAETLQALAFALKHDGKRAFRNGDILMAEITAAHLLAYLDRAGIVVMKRPPVGGTRTPSSEPI